MKSGAVFCILLKLCTRHSFSVLVVSMLSCSPLSLSFSLFFLNYTAKGYTHEQMVPKAGIQADCINVIIITAGRMPSVKTSSETAFWWVAHLLRWLRRAIFHSANHNISNLIVSNLNISNLNISNLDMMCKVIETARYKSAKLAIH